MPKLDTMTYDASVGRFISEDTYRGNRSYPITLNLYTYVNNNPLKYIDLSGQWYITVQEYNNGRQMYIDVIYEDKIMGAMKIGINSLPFGGGL